MNMTKLTPKQENFCNYYLETGNASEAYRRAYSCENMKDETVNERSCRLLKEYKISTRVKQLQLALQERSDIAKDEVVKELTAIVRARITDVLNIKGSKVTIKKLEDMPDHVVSCIASVKKAKDSIEVKFYDKIAAIDRLSRMLGWNEADRIDLKGSVPINAWLEKMSNEELDEFIRSEIDRQGFIEPPKE